MKLIRKLYLFLIMGTAFANQTVMVDPHFSPYSGSANLIFVEDLLIQGEDAYFKNSNKNSTGKVLGRTLEQFVFWYNINMLAAVTQHEVFGHGYRLRQLGYTPTGYEISSWGGATSFKEEDYRSMKVGEALAITVAGLEAEQILARDLKMQWIRKGEIDGRLSVLYNQAEQSIFWYTLITHNEGLKANSDSENDIQSYMYFHNHSYPNGKLTHGKLLRWTLFNWLDPMTFYSYYAFFYYMAEGKSWKFPMFSIGEHLRYLPNVKVGYAPYAPEAYLENYFLYKGDPIYLYIKGGKRSFGIGVSYDHVYSGRRGSVGFRFDGWNQGIFMTPITTQELKKTGTAFRPILNKRRFGAALSLIGRLNVSSKFAFFGELGGKTAGYLPGYGLDREIVARVGLTFGPNGLKEKISRESQGTVQNVREEHKIN